jgi:hypothetical protein
VSTSIAPEKRLLLRKSSLKIISLLNTLKILLEDGRVASRQEICGKCFEDAVASRHEIQSVRGELSFLRTSTFILEAKFSELEGTKTKPRRRSRTTLAKLKPRLSNLIGQKGGSIILSSETEKAMTDMHAQLKRKPYPPTPIHGIVEKPGYALSVLKLSVPVPGT